MELKRKSDVSLGLPFNKKPRLEASSNRYWNGALRLTRTPGRIDNTPGRSVANTISMDELVDCATLQSAFIASFFIGQDELFDFLPFKETTTRSCEVYISRDFFQDADGMAAAKMSAGTLRKTISEDLFKQKTAIAAAHYKKVYGQNFNAVYRYMTGGCAHSKILLLRYPDFLRVVITSANLMALDIQQGDNIWFIQDIPPLIEDPHRSKIPQSDFESILLEHAKALACPEQFLKDVRDKYDFSTVRARIVTSHPGAYKGPDAERYGQLRLRRVIQDLGFKDSTIDLESCTGSIGSLEPLWLHRFFDSFCGKRQDAKITSITRLPPMKIIYPTRADVLNSLFRELSQGMSDSDAIKYIEEQASNIGSHLRWKNASDMQKRLYHHFLSKDPKKPLFHMKLLLAFPRGQRTTRPLYLYTGSANLSASAWGKAEHDKKAGAAGEMRLAGITNFECGVVIKGEDLESMLAEGTWEEAIPFQRPAIPYQLTGASAEKPWNSPAWVQGR